MSEIFDLYEELTNLRAFLLAGNVKHSQAIAGAAFVMMLNERIAKLKTEMDQYDAYVDQLAERYAEEV
jgi:flagellar biosynthesis chaperone FliJ